MSSSRTALRRSSRGSWASRPPILRAPDARVTARLRAFALTCLLVVITLGVGWMVWSVVEWRHGRTVSYRLTGLRVVSRTDGRPIGLGRSVLRNAVCCTILLIPTIAFCVVLAVAFVMGASPPNDLLTKPHRGTMGPPHRNRSPRRAASDHRTLGFHATDGAPWRFCEHELSGCGRARWGTGDPQATSGRRFWPASCDRPVTVR